MTSIMVEIGPGNKRIDDTWVTVGPYVADHVDFVSRWGEDILPFVDDSVDLIYASHVLEHVWWHKTVDALKDAYRILKPHGKIEIHVPDFAVIAHAYTTKRCGDDWMKFNPDRNYMKWINGRLFTYGGPGNTHRATFDRSYLETCLREAGFNIIEYTAPIRGNDHGKINLAMTGIKGD